MGVIHPSELLRQQFREIPTPIVISIIQRYTNKQILPLCHLSLNLVTYHHEVARIPLGEVSRESCSVSLCGDPLMSCPIHNMCQLIRGREF